MRANANPRSLVGLCARWLIGSILLGLLLLPLALTTSCDSCKDNGEGCLTDDQSCSGYCTMEHNLTVVNECRTKP